MSDTPDLSKIDANELPVHKATAIVEFVHALSEAMLYEPLHSDKLTTINGMQKFAQEYVDTKYGGK